MDGSVKLILLGRGEEYTVTLPYANCKGILIGKLTMELGGKVTIECAKTGYSAEIEFKLKPLLGGTEASNIIDGKIKFAKETIAQLHGKWDGEIILQEKSSPLAHATLWHANAQVIETRLKRYTVPYEAQTDFESEKLWSKVSEAIRMSDQNLATEEKSRIELKQREKRLSQRETTTTTTDTRPCNATGLTDTEHKSKLFTYDPNHKEWLYNYFDLRPWDTITDLYQYEHDFRIMTKTKHNLTNFAAKRSIINELHVRHNQPRKQQQSQQKPQPLPEQQQKQEKQILKQSSDDLVASEALLSHFNDVKQRLDKIEESLSLLGNKFAPTTKTNVMMRHYPRLDERTEFVIPSLLKSPGIVIFLCAWVLGMVTVIASKSLFF
jgi:hypothetical protein